MTGAGSYRAGGRWSTPGHYVVYASGNLTLAMLELLVHIDDAEKFRQLAHIYHRVDFSETAVAVLEEQDLPDGWDDRPETRASQIVGDEWLERRQSVILAVPSVIVPPELRYDPSYMNYLINPNHPELESSIEVGEVSALIWDPRLGS